MDVWSFADAGGEKRDGEKSKRKTRCGKKRYRQSAKGEYKLGLVNYTDIFGVWGYAWADECGSKRLYYVGDLLFAERVHGNDICRNYSAYDQELVGVYGHLRFSSGLNYVIIRSI